MTRPIVFLTDYGMADEFVGVCHGVMLRIAPDARVVDLTHSIPRQDVMRGALTLGRATSYMPADAVYVAVVDPGVGSGRGSIAVRAASGAFLVGPDNGLLSLAWEALGGAEARRRDHVRRRRPAAGLTDVPRTRRVRPRGGTPRGGHAARRARSSARRGRAPGAGAARAPWSRREPSAPG